MYKMHKYYIWNKLEIIYKSNQKAKQISLGLDRQRALIKRKVQVLLM